MPNEPSIKANPLTCIRHAINHLQQAYKLVQRDPPVALPDCIQAQALIKLAMENMNKI